MPQAMAALAAAMLGCGDRTALTADLTGAVTDAEGASDGSVGEEGGATPETGCFMAGVQDPAGSCIYLSNTVPDFQCPMAPGPAYEMGTCPSSGLFGCCVVTMLGSYASTHAICYYSPDKLALAARKSCESWMPAGATVTWQTSPP
jgi:hypothetical protein